MIEPCGFVGMTVSLIEPKSSANNGEFLRIHCRPKGILVFVLLVQNCAQVFSYLCYNLYYYYYINERIKRCLEKELNFLSVL